jgi:Na+(H+)/acetate symporter ActP
MSGMLRKVIEDLATCHESNRVLSASNAEYRLKDNQFTEAYAKLQMNDAEIRQLRTDKNACLTQNSDLNTQKNVFIFLSVVFGIMAGLVILPGILTKFITGDVGNWRQKK